LGALDNRFDYGAAAHGVIPMAMSPSSPHRASVTGLPGSTRPRVGSGRLPSPKSERGSRRMQGARERRQVPSVHMQTTKFSSASPAPSRVADPLVGPLCPLLVSAASGSQIESAPTATIRQCLWRGGGATHRSAATRGAPRCPHVGAGSSGSIEGR
jgi:hypothetical protein